MRISLKVMLIATGALMPAAHASSTVTGEVMYSYTEGESYVIELDQPNGCGSSRFETSTDPSAISAAEAAVVASHQLHNNVVTINTGACIGATASIQNVTPG